MLETDLTHKTALVCGSTQGIGKATAHLLAALGATVTLCARDAVALSDAAKSLPTPNQQPHDFIVADFAKPEVLKTAVANYLNGGRGFHILVNNTGGPAPGQAIEADPAQFETAFRMHLVCNQYLAQSCVPFMKAEGYGRIVNVISTSVKAPIPNLGVSNTIRGAVASWAKTLATELAPYGITVNNVLPGFTKTARLDALIANRAEKASVPIPEYEASMKAQIPARRFAEASEVAAGIAFLASPAAAYINGINLPVDGGNTPTL